MNIKTIRFAVFLSIILVLSSCKKPVSVYNSDSGHNSCVEYGEHKDVNNVSLKGLQEPGNTEETYGPSNVFTVKNIKEDSFSKGEKVNTFSPNSFEIVGTEFNNSDLNNNSSISAACESKCENTCEKVSPELVKQKEAKLADIPVPMSADPIMEYFNAENSKRVVVLGYYSELEASKISKFYSQEMELYGWENVYSFDGLLEKSMLFKKPSRYCSISIRSNLSKSSFFKKNNYKTQIVLFSQI